MSSKLSDQLELSNILTLEPRKSNVLIDGDSVRIEQVNEYLHRVDINSRYLGLEVLVIYPFGNYNIVSFIENIKLGNIQVTKYRFDNITDEGFNQIIIQEITIVNDLVTGGTDSALSAEQGKVLKQFMNNYMTQWGELSGDIENQSDLVERFEFLKRYNFMT